MRVFRTLHYRLTKRDSPGSVLRAVTDALVAAGLGDALLTAQIEDMPDGKTLASERLTKKYPRHGTTSSVSTVEGDPGRTRFTISGVRLDADETRDILDIAAGIPRTYPAFIARFAIDGVDWSRLDPSMPPAVRAMDEKSHGAIIVTSYWWSTGRLNALTASIELPLPPADAAAPPEIPATVRAVADRFGKMHHQTMEVVRDAETGRQEKARALNQKYDGALAELAATLPFPHLLVTPLEAGSAYVPGNVGTYKDALKAVFGARGYRYETKRSGEGVFSLTKKTPANHEIELKFEIGSYSKSYGGMFKVKGEGWFVRAILPVTAWENQFAWYPIVNAEIWRRILENVAVAVDHYEQTVVPDAEAAFGAMPRWYLYES